MKIIIENTTKIVHVNNLPCRIWEGHTESGIPVHVFITRIGVHKNEQQQQFETELQICRQPSAEIEAYPSRMVL